MVSFVFHWDQSNKFQMQETKKIKKKNRENSTNGKFILYIEFIVDKSLCLVKEWRKISEQIRKCNLSESKVDAEGKINGKIEFNCES